MKTYEIILLTNEGIKKELYQDTESLEEFENKMIKKYPHFIMQSSKEITHLIHVKK